MKKIVLVAAAAGLMTLAACTPKASDNGANDVDAMGNTIDNGAMGDEMMGNDAMMSNDTMGNDAMMDSNSAM